MEGPRAWRAALCLSAQPKKEGGIAPALQAHQRKENSLDVLPLRLL